LKQTDLRRKWSTIPKAAEPVGRPSVLRPSETIAAAIETRLQVMPLFTTTPPEMTRQPSAFTLGSSTTATAIRRPVIARWTRILPAIITSL
jgi:hypothetical protein